MRIASQCLVLAFVASCAAAFIVPEELVSFLSIVYSNIPPIKKGTDSRVGVGFRLGPHADAQFVLELGPQQNTRPIGPNADNRKRHTALDPLDYGLDNNAATAPGVGNPAASDWLTNWRTSVAQTGQAPSVNEEDKDLVAYPDPTKLSGAPLVSHLRQLYRKDSKKASEVSAPGEKSARRKPVTKPPKEDLSDVSLD